MAKHKKIETKNNKQNKTSSELKRTKDMKQPESYATGYIKHHRNIILLMTITPLLVMGLVVGVFYRENTTNQGASAASLTIYPPQPGAVIYNSDAPSSYARAGAMVDMNSAETPGAKAVSNAGGTVLVYVDTIADGSGGNYAGMINGANSCGPAIGRWPGANQFNSYGYVRDLRVLVNSGKLKCILEKVVADNPHMGGFFADDLGTTNPQYSGSIATRNGGCSIPTDEFYGAVINTLKVFRQVADANGLMVMVNGTYQGGSCNGGYPNRSLHGTSLAEGSCIEHHSRDAFFANYTASSQWADASPITNGQAAHFVIVYPGDNSWNTDPNTAWITQQSSYSSAPAPWTSNFHPTGLPTRVSGGTSSPPPQPSPTPPPPSPTLPPSTPPATQSPYSSAISIPGKLQAENYDKGGEGVAFHDTSTSNQGGQYRADAVDIENNNEGGYSIGWVSSGEWLEYITNITSSGTYDITFRVATAATSSGSWTLKQGSTTLATGTTSNTGGWYTWKDVTVKNVSLSSGSNKVLRLEASGQPLNIDSLTFTKQGSSPPAPTPPPSPSPSPIPSNPPPPITVPGAGTTDPVDIPDELPVNDDGTIIADFNGDGLNEVVKDTNNDGQIDPNTEIVIDGTTNQELTDLTQSPISPNEYSSLLNNSGNLTQTPDTDTVTLKPGPLPEVRIAKPVAYTFLIAQGIALTGIGTYLALTKLAIFAGIRGRLGL